MIGLGFHAAKAQPVNIHFEVSGIGATKARIIGIIGTQQFLIDSLETDNQGSVIYKKEKALPGGLYYFVYDNNKFFQFLADEDQEFSMKTVKGKHVQSMVVEGSIDNELFYKNLKFEEDFQAKLKDYEAQIEYTMVNSRKRDTITAKRDSFVATRKDHIKWFADNHPNSFFTVFKLAGQNPDLTYPKLPDGTLDTAAQVYKYRQDYWNNTDLTDERILRTPVLANKLKTYITQITDQKPDSVIKSLETIIEMSKPNKEVFKFIVNWAALEYQKPKIMGMDAVFVHLIRKYWTLETAFWSNAEEIKNLRRDAGYREVSLLGKTGQDLVCNDPEGNPERLYDLPGPARILYMWSYSCDHCRERTPVLVEVLNKWKAKGLQVYALCLDDDKDKWKAAIKKYGMEVFTNVIDPGYKSGYYKKYHVDITPELYVMDKDWKIVSKDLHPNQIDGTLKKLLD